MTIKRSAAGILALLLLAGCAGAQFSLGGPAEPSKPAPTVAMAGHWTLSVPGAASCGMNFGAAAPVAKDAPNQATREGSIAPEGGCPGNFFTSRHWTIENGALTIADHQFKPLAQLKLANGVFEGQASAGGAVTLAR
jgi:hypothetical protein